MNLFNLIVGVVIATIFWKSWPSVQKRLSESTRLIKKYWLVSGLIVVITAGAHFLNFKYIEESLRQTVFNLINFYGGLFFAIFTGFFGFSQIQANRFDKLKKEAHDAFLEKEYERAERLYKEALAINARDYTVVSELAELFLITKKNQPFTDMVNRLDKIIVEDKERITFYYLKVAQALVAEDIGAAKKELKQLLRYVNKKPQALERFGWDFNDLKRSPLYGGLTGDSKTILETLISFLGKSIADADREKFIKDYGKAS